jgi:holo-[acyl-carrier protein] synthase
MIIGIGLDMVDVDRMREALERGGQSFEDRVFTLGERDYCSRRADRALALAARFAAKEAFFKALGTGFGEGNSLLDVEIVSLENGRPTLRVSGAAEARARELGVRSMHVSLTHEHAVAAGVVVLEA